MNGSKRLLLGYFAILTAFLTFNSCCRDCDNEADSGLEIDWSEVAVNAPIPEEVELLFFSEEENFIRNVTSPPTVFRGEIPQTTKYILALGYQTSTVVFNNIEDINKSQAWLPALFTINDTVLINPSGWVYSGLVERDDVQAEAPVKEVVKMRQCNRIIQFILEVKGTSAVSEVIARLTGLSRGVNLETLANLSQTGSSDLEFLKSGQLFTSEINCFGISPLPSSNELIMELIFSNGKKRIVSVSLTDALKNANQNKTIPLVVPLTLEFKDAVGVEGSIKPWEQNAPITISVN